MITVVSVILFILLLVSFALVFQYVAHYIYDYKTQGRSVCILLFKKIPLSQIAFENIAEIRKISYKEAVFGKETLMALRLGNRIWGDIILIRKKKGIIKTILITPDNATQFLQQVKSHL